MDKTHHCVVQNASIFLLKLASKQPNSETRMCSLMSALLKWKALMFGLFRKLFLEWWNRTKSLSSSWQHFSCLLDDELQKIWKKLNSHGSFLRAGQKCASRWAELAVQAGQKAIVGIQFLSYFWNLLIKYKTWKTLSNPPNTFLGISIL